MITIKTIDENNAEMHMDKGTSYITVLLGIEMLIESLLNETNGNIDDLLSDLKRIYIRDNVLKDSDK